MYRFDGTTLNLFRHYRFAVRKYLPQITHSGDRAELSRMIHIFYQKKMEKKNCSACAAVRARRNSSPRDTCAVHYHDDYGNHGFECCWICYVKSVFERQLYLAI